MQEKREDATQRQAERDERSPGTQLRRLDTLLGAGVGAKKERAKLVAQIAGDR